MKRRLRLTAVLEEDASGFFAYCPQLQGCYSQGRTYELARRNLLDAIRLHLQDRRGRGEPFPEERSVSLTQVEVMV